MDLHGHSGAKPTLLIIPRPGGLPRNTLGTDIPITEAPIVPIQIGDKEYRLWLQSVNNEQYNPNGAIQLSVHFKQLPYGLEKVEYDNEGYVTDYWYKN